MSLVYAATAAGTTLTDSTVETSLGSYTFPANFFQLGKVIKFRATVATPSSNSTDTLVIKAKIGSATLYTSAAVDQANGDVQVVEGTLTCRGNPGASVVLAGGGFAMPPDASGTAATGWAAVTAGQNTAGALALDITGTWSVAHASNQCALQSLVIEELV
jgi:hypothetical protein